ncbi:MAG: T9SS type A sorting domain-containing protein [Flavobacteriales bacterium]|nr:T9SS type A sorting domain-containing protein [Flavobacteriales bacterium]
MKYLTTYLILFWIICGMTVSAQTVRCGTSEKMQELLSNNPDIQVIRDNLEEFTERWVDENSNTGERAVVTIPVVVHVVYKTNAENISDAQIQSQIDVLNEDLRAMNADAANVPSVWNNLIADCEIQFSLAKQTPNGEWTNGITRTETDVDNWNASDNVKFTSEGGEDAWPANDYLNIWVCNIGSNFLGYTYQPGVNPNIDGVVIGYRFFGTVGNVSNTYDLGRTTTHEIGHYFNLYHPWGGGASNNNCSSTDFISDTPIQGSPNFGCETFPNVSCSNAPNGDMFMNFMDYSNDDCLIFFTPDQKNRMLATLNGPRAGLLTSNGLTIGIEEQALQNTLSVYPNPSSSVINIRFDNNRKTLSDIRILDLLGKEIFSYAMIDLSTTSYQIDVSQLTGGIYLLEVKTDNGHINRKINIIE